MKLLTLALGHRLHREQAMDLLWPDSGKKAASNNLSQILHVARRALTSDPAEGSRYLTCKDESLVLCPGGELWVDVDAFEEAAATARRARDPGAYRAALELYSGELLPGDRYEPCHVSYRLLSAFSARMVAVTIANSLEFKVLVITLLPHLHHERRSLPGSYLSASILHPNFGDNPFHATRVNKGKKKGRSLEIHPGLP
jgi:hypothetical protein